MFWGTVACVGLVAFGIALAAIVGLVASLLPSGDSWGVVAARLSFVALVILGLYWLIKIVSTAFPIWFRGKLSDELLDAIARDETPEEPKTATAAAFKNWQLAVIAIVAFCVAFGAIDLDSPWLDIDLGPKRTRGFVRLLQWCQGNPNTIKSSAVIVGVAALARYLFQIRRAAAKPKATTPVAEQATKP